MSHMIRYCVQYSYYIWYFEFISLSPTPFIYVEVLGFSAGNLRHDIERSFYVALFKTQNKKYASKIKQHGKIQHIFLMCWHWNQRGEQIGMILCIYSYYILNQLRSHFQIIARRYWAQHSYNGDALTHLGRVTHICVVELGHHWFR